MVYHKAPDSDCELSENDIALAYQHQVKIEECFRILKHNIRLRPVYVSTPDHIRGHVMVCFLSLLLFRLLEYKLKQCGIILSIEEISAVLSGTKLVAGRLNEDIIFMHVNDYQSEAKQGAKTKSDSLELNDGSITNNSPIICKLLEALNMKAPARFNNYSDLNICFNRKFKSALEYIDESLIDKL